MAVVCSCGPLIILKCNSFFRLLQISHCKIVSNVVLVYLSFYECFFGMLFYDIIFLD